MKLCDEARDQEYFLAEQKLNLEFSVTLLFVISFLFFFVYHNLLCQQQGETLREENSIQYLFIA